MHELENFFTFLEQRKKTDIKEEKLLTFLQSELFKISSEHKSDSESFEENINEVLSEEISPKEELVLEEPKTSKFRKSKLKESVISKDDSKLTPQDVYVDYIKSEEKLKKLQQSNSKSVNTEKEISDIQLKIRFLETFLTKLSNDSGSGEVNLRFLDDVNRNTIENGKFLKYNSSNTKFEFDDIKLDYIQKGITSVINTVYVVSNTDYYIGVDCPSNTEIILQSSSVSGKELLIKDESGNCVNNPITISGNIDNDSNGVVLMINNGSLHLIYNNGWRII